MTTNRGPVPIAPHETSVDELERVIRSGHRAIILEADTFRPLAAYVYDLMKASYAAGQRDALVSKKSG